jgi:hypothetical protein
MKNIIQKITYILIILCLVVTPVLVFAQVTGGGGGSGSVSLPIRIANPFNCGNAGAGNCTLMTLINSILSGIVMPIAAVGVTVWIIWAGFGFITAQGNPGEIQKAKQRLLWALVGAGILLGAVGISAVVTSTVRALIAP